MTFMCKITLNKKYKLNKGGDSMKKSLKVVLIVVGCIVALSVIIGGIAFFAVGNTANAEEYELGNDTVKSIKAVVEKRKVVSVSTEISNGVETKKMEYKSDNVQEDLTKYATYLKNEAGYVLTKDMNLSLSSSTIQFGKESQDSGKILLLTIDYDPFGYTITFQKGEGTLTLY